MSFVAPRSFDCPETEEPCIRGDCNKGEPCRMALEAAKAEAAPREKVFNRSTYEAAQAIMKRLKPKK